MALHYHLERRLSFKETSAETSLYPWAIVEVGETGKVIGRDYIPWQWRQYFSATKLSFSEQLTIRTEGGERFLKRTPGVEFRRRIHGTLRAGDDRQEDWFRGTTYRMFGSDRPITAFFISIHALSSEEELEECRAWGCPSYDSADDFRPDTTEDVLEFYLLLRPSRFQGYVDRIAAGTIDEVVLSVSGVDGFYSEWSPDIETRDIKVLCSGDLQPVELSEDLSFELPRLHAVGEAELQINAGVLGARGEPHSEEVHEAKTRKGLWNFGRAK